MLLRLDVLYGVDRALPKVHWYTREDIERLAAGKHIRYDAASSSTGTNLP